MGRGGQDLFAGAEAPRRPRLASSGYPELDREIERFAVSEAMHEFDYRDPKQAHARCGIVSRAFCDHLRNAGFRAWQSSDVVIDAADGSEELPMALYDWAECSEGYGEKPESFGYHDRPIRGLDDHEAVFVELAGDYVMVDWSASQYGYADYPLIQRLNEYGEWERRVDGEWRDLPLEHEA